MTVADLILYLKGYDADLEVVILAPDDTFHDIGQHYLGESWTMPVCILAAD